MNADIRSLPTTVTQAPTFQMSITKDNTSVSPPSPYKPMGTKFIIQVPIVVSNSNDVMAVARLMPDHQHVRDVPEAILDLSRGVMGTSFFQLTSSYVNNHTGAYQVKILQTVTPPMNLQHRDAHRFMKGRPRYAFQITSDATLRGHLVLCPIYKARRKFLEYTPVGMPNPKPYLGYELLDLDLNLSHLMQNGHTLVDLSTDRLIYVQAPDIPQNPFYDMDWLRSLYDTGYSIDDINSTSEFFLENAIAISPLSDISTTGPNPGVITIEAFADYSEVEFYTEMLPCFSYYNQSTSSAYINLVNAYKKNNRSGQLFPEGVPAKAEDLKSLSQSDEKFFPDVNEKSVPEDTNLSKGDNENEHKQKKKHRPKPIKFEIDPSLPNGHDFTF